MTTQELFNRLPRLNRTDRVLLLTHTDLDGSGAAILLRTAYGRQFVAVKHCGNDLMSTAIREAVLDPEAKSVYDCIVVCDISCSEEDAAAIDKCTTKPKLILLDHHLSANHLNKYDWAVVTAESPSDSLRMSEYRGADPSYKPLASGTALLYDYLEYVGLVSSLNKGLRQFAHIVSAYDTWEWVDIFNRSKVCQDMNRLRGVYGLRRFEDAMVERLKQPTFVPISKFDRAILELEEERITTQVEHVAKRIHLTECVLSGRAYSLAYCFTDMYPNEVFEYMKHEYADIDIYAIVIGSAVSLRTLRDDISLAELVSPFGGGGHAAAAGFRIEEGQQERMLKLILEPQSAVSPTAITEFFDTYGG